ncbi:MAG: low molecular weight phosphotyrosine protein phosphatase [Paludibacteraceae bacterium]|nr:low molecular weight phosphotyrosine protein phosphatase [Paludibacteraceae bacterium]MBR0291160.1 low molecular weight phosphotyrosine protein phosphatase [Bacteroidales bacterium]
MTHILFVCHGNICRSPMAEFVLKALVKAKGIEDQYYIESAAVTTDELGNPIYPPAKRCLSQHGVSFDPAKRARQITRSDYDLFDRIICMDASNMRLIRRIIPSDPDGKIHLLMSYAGSGRDVADPWYTGDFETAFQDILTGCEAMLSSF